MKHTAADHGAIRLIRNRHPQSIAKLMPAGHCIFACTVMSMGEFRFPCATGWRIMQTLLQTFS
jgi:hypothetical protein